MKVHELKCVEPYFSEVREGRKTFEVRRNDRDFSTGDILYLRSFDESLARGYDGRSLAVIVVYTLRGGAFGIDADYCVMGIRVVAP